MRQFLIERYHQKYQNVLFDTISFCLYHFIRYLLFWELNTHPQKSETIFYFYTMQESQRLLAFFYVFLFLETRDYYI